MDGLIWVVDSADRNRLKESQIELMNLLQCDLIRGGIPIIIFANKQDMKHALHPSDVARFLEFHKLTTKEGFKNVIYIITNNYGQQVGHTNIQEIKIRLSYMVRVRFQAKV